MNLGVARRWPIARMLGGCGLLAVLTACDTPQPAPAGPATPALVRGGQPAPAATALSLPSGPLAHAPWAPSSCTVKTAGVLACVDGAPITRSQFDAAWAAAPNGTAAATVVQSLIDAEVLAQAAARGGAWRDPQLQPMLRQRAVARLLDHHAATIVAANIADADIEKAYRNPQIQPRYNHVDAWITVDAQMLCCSGDPRQCAKREEVQACIDNLAAQAQAVYAALSQPVPQSADEMWARTRVLGDRFADLVPAEVRFYYDKSRPHDQQKGYDVVVREFAEAVVDLQPGQLHPPVRSAFGWHIPYLSKIDGAVHKTWRDADVRAEIAAHIVDPVRQREVQRLSFEAMRRRNVQFFYERLEPASAAAANAEAGPAGAAAAP